MARKPKIKVEEYSEFADVKFPTKVLCVSQPVRCDIWEGNEYTTVDRYKFAEKYYLVVLDDASGRELYFQENYFVLVN